MTNTLFRTVATVALTLAASGTVLFGTLAPAQNDIETHIAADAGLRGVAATRIVA